MNEEAFNMSIRKFLKTVGVKSQHEIERAVEQARAQGHLKGDEALAAHMTLKIPQLGLEVPFEGRIDLE